MFRAVVNIYIDSMIDNVTSKKKNKTVYFSIMIGILTIFLVFYVYYLLGQNYPESVSAVQDQPFTLKVGSEVYQDAILSEIEFPLVPKGTQISYSAPLKGDVNNPLLHIFMSHSVGRVYLDDELIYTYGEPDWHMFGYGYLNIPIDNDFAGKELRVEQDVMESGEIGHINTPSVCDASCYYNNMIASNRLILFVDITIIILSITVVISGLIFMNTINEIKNLIWIAAAFFVMGLWEFCNSNLISLFIGNDLSLKGYLEYLSLYTGPFLFTMYFADGFTIKKNKIERYLFYLLVTFMFIFPIVGLILHFADVIHLPKILYIGHITIIVSLIYVLAVNIRLTLRKDNVHRVMVIGTFILVTVTIIDMARYLVIKFIFKDGSYKSIVLIGVYIYALCVILDFLSTHNRTILAEAKTEALEKIAYYDIMTDIYNRQKINQIVREIAGKKGRTRFGILSFDLNDLKKANDEYGHLVGDKLLSDFAGLLKEVFWDKGIVARMGGDEFIVVFDDIERSDIDALIEKLESRKDEVNAKRKDIPISYAYGYAEATDEELKELKELKELSDATEDEGMKVVRMVYKRSDDQMYENKATMKRAGA